MYQISANTNPVPVHSNDFVDKHNLAETTTDMNNYPYVLTPPMDSPESNMLSPISGSNSPTNYNTYIPQGMCQQIYTSSGNSPVLNQVPILKIVEEPVERFRFRYKSEMAGTHGSLTGRTSDRSRKQTYPTVELYNFGKPAVIRCSLYQYSREDMKHTRQPHAHRLVRKQGTDEIDDPHDLHVNSDTGYAATFHSMGIIHTAKKYIVTELDKKNKKLKLEDIARTENACRSLTKKEEQEIRVNAEKESKSINLNIVCLRFDAFQVIDNIYYQLCPPIYSSSINNLKSALTGDLKIVRMDHFTSYSRGGKEIFILVEKVTKKNIKVRFYELDDEDNEIWSDYGRFTDLDVHHQYAIVFKTPPYKLLDIENEVKVFIELQRPSDGARSEPKDFTYTPSKIMHNRKRPRFTSSSYSSSMYSSDELPLTIPNLQNTNEHFPNPAINQNTVVSSGELDEALRQNNINSEEFDKICTKFLNSNTVPIFDLYANELSADDIANLQSGLVTDAPHMDKKFISTDLGSSASANRPLRSLTPEEQKIITRFQEEFVAFVKTNPPMKRMSQMLQNLFENPAFITKNMETVLHLLISANNQRFLSSLLIILFKYQQTELVNKTNGNRQTALHLAVESHNSFATEVLVNTKADVTIADLQGNTVFHTAVLESAPVVILKMLCMTDGALRCIDALNYEGITALHLAVKFNNIPATKVLCWRKADVNAEDKKNGDTILHTAVKEKRLEIVTFLLEFTEADIEKENYGQCSPLKIAKLLENNTPITKQIYQVFEEYMKRKGVYEKVTIKEEIEDMSDEEMETSDCIIKEEFDDLKEKYSKIKVLTEECLNEVSDILDKSGTWHNLAELLDYGHLIRNNLIVSSKNLLQFAMKKEENVYEIRNFLENLDEIEAVESIDNMVNKMFI